jgi:hypothetical protein
MNKTKFFDVLGIILKCVGIVFCLVGFTLFAYRNVDTIFSKGKYQMSVLGAEVYRLNTVSGEVVKTTFQEGAYWGTVILSPGEYPDDGLVHRPISKEDKEKEKQSKEKK